MKRICIESKESPNWKQQAEGDKVYVGTMKYRFGRMIMFHMASPNIEALHSMAEKIGINRKWFQNKGQDERFPHYDICLSKKALAMQNGAIEVNDRELITKCYPNRIS